MALMIAVNRNHVSTVSRLVWSILLQIIKTIFPVEKVFNLAGFSQEESEELMIHLYLNLA